MEQLVLDAMAKQLEKKKIIRNSQHGCSRQVETVERAGNEGEHCEAVCFPCCVLWGCAGGSAVAVLFLGRVGRSLAGPVLLKQF